MKRIALLILTGLALPTAIWAQSTFQFSINFNETRNSYPYGSATLSQGLLKASIGIGTNWSEPTNSLIVQKTADNTLTPLFMFMSGFAVQSGTIDLNTGVMTPSGPVYYTLQGTWSLTADQTQDLLNGQWYASVNVGADTYLGQLTPVPEPSVWLLAPCGAGFLVGVCRRKIWTRT